jgi:diguanylate cyclase (GGDEF)-like protein
VDGLELLRRVRSAPRATSPYIVAVIDLGDDDALFTAMSAGADDFLVQPAQPEQLHARLQVAERVCLLARHLARTQDEVAQYREALRASARTDGLTGLWNRLQLHNDLELFQGQLQRYGHRYAAAIIDVDRLELFNETNGRIAGDEALRVVADTIARQLRTGDRAYRYGGDEFVVLLPEQSATSARTAVERIREAIDALHLPHAGNPPWNQMTVSAGIATFGTDAATTYDALLGHAEAALQTAKVQGGNRVEPVATN